MIYYQRMKITRIVWLSLVGIVIGGGSYFLLKADPEPTSGDAGLHVEVGGRETSVESSTNGRVRRVARNRRVPRSEEKLMLAKKLDFDEDEESKLSADQKALLDEIRKVLDAEDRDGLIRIVQKMQKSDEWPDGIPVAIRKAAIEALGWFGRDCLPEMLGFVADSDAEVRETVYESYEQSLFEANGDLELSQLIVAASKVINDFDAMDSLLMWLNDMRPSRQKDTIIDILKNGTPEAKKAAIEAAKFITGDDDADTPEEMEAWYNDPSGDNKDNEDAEDFYGAQKD